MDEFAIFLFKYTINYKESNRLGNKSCKFLTKASFPLLVELDLCNFVLI